MLIINAPPAAAPKVLDGELDFSPNISFIIFSAGTINASATIEYNIFLVAKSIALLIKTTYSNK